MEISNERLAHELTMQYLNAISKMENRTVSQYVSAYFARYNEILKEIENKRKPNDSDSDSESNFGAQW